ncbi:hypothetical protein KJ766_00590 [Patescibacteria group bacterium]|nr:hypothetical protein [Patescibacteria group bacterium]
MKKVITNFIAEFWILGILAIVLPSIALAHQPRLVETNYIEIQNPEVSQAFYAELTGTSDIYRIENDIDFRLYAGLTVPATASARTDFTLGIYQIIDSSVIEIGFFNGSDYEWELFHEKFGNDDYLKGPEFFDNEWVGSGLRGLSVQSGEYLIKIDNSDHAGQYVLAIGDIESFPAEEALNAMFTIPKLKVQFFEKSKLSFLESPFISIPLIAIAIISASLLILGFLVFRIFKKRKKNK